MLPVAIVGRAFRLFASPKLDLKGKDVWAFNAGAMRHPIAAAFQMHRIPPYVRDEKEDKVYREWLSKITVPVYMWDKCPEFPTSIRYPFEEVARLTSHVRCMNKELIFNTSSVSYAVALAVLQERKQIDVYGVELEMGTEYEKQQGCYLFWVGFAAGKGINLNIYCGETIFRKPLYGEKGIEEKAQ